MAITKDQILALYNERRAASSPLIESMAELRDIVNGDVMVPLPELARQEKPAVANLISEGIDQIGTRVSSTMPHLIMPAIHARVEKGTGSLEWADIRRRAVLSWWQEGRLRRLQRRRARFLVAYGAAPVQIKPDFDKGIPSWSLRHPLHTYPSPSEWHDDDQPRDCIFAFRRPFAWIAQHYPEAARQVEAAQRGRGFGAIARSRLFMCLEYTDDVETVLVLVGAPETPHQQGITSHPAYCVELERVPNRAGVCTVVTPSRVTLDRLQGQFNQLIGPYLKQAELMALDTIATRKSVFPDLVLVGQNGRPPMLLGDEWKDGLTGEINEVSNGDVKVIQLQPGFKVGESMDRLERAMRVSGVNQGFGGEAGANIRSGRQIEMSMSAQVDFRIQEYQETLADSLVLENKRAIAVAKAYFGDEKKSFYVHWKGAKGHVDYVPNKHFETDVNVVAYPMPGADVNGLLMGIGNRLGMGLMSRDTGRELDPLVDDPEVEKDRVVTQRLEDSLLDSISQMAAQGQIPPADVAAIMKKVYKEDMPLADAVEAVQREAQERQAAEVEPGDPAGMPGLAVPGAGAEAGLAIGEPEPSMENLSSLLYTLRQPSGPAGGRAPAMSLGGMA